MTTADHTRWLRSQIGVSLRQAIFAQRRAAFEFQQIEPWLDRGYPEVAQAYRLAAECSYQMARNRLDRVMRLRKELQK